MSSVAAGEHGDWAAQHAAQLASIGLPQSLHRRLATKLTDQIFDVGTAISFVHHAASNWSVVAIRKIAAEEDVWLSDHIWLYPDESVAKAQLDQCEELKSRVLVLLGEDEVIEHAPDDVLASVAALAHPIEFDNSEGSRQLMFYLNDEFGTRIESTAGAVNVKAAAVLDYASGATFTVVWPVQNIDAGDKLLRAVHTAAPAKLFWGKGYWEQRFMHEENYDWYCKWADLEHAVLGGLRESTADEPSVILVPGNGSSPLPVQLLESLQHRPVRVIAADFATDLADKMASQHPDAAVEWVTEDLTTDGRLWQSLFETGVDLIVDKGCMDAFLVKPVEQRKNETDHWLTHKDDTADAMAYLSHCARALLGRQGTMAIVTLTGRAVTEPLMRKAGLSVLSWDDSQLGNNTNIVLVRSN